MPASLSFPSTCFIHRHALQTLIHEFQIQQTAPTGGFLFGSNSHIQGSITADKYDNEYTPEMLCGIYQHSDRDGNIREEDRYQLNEQFQTLRGSSPLYYMILQHGEKGRIDVLVFSGNSCRNPIELVMLEDDELDPSGISC